MMNEKEFYKFLSVFIKTKRKELKLTNENLAYSSNTDVSKISLLQNNKTGCNAFTLYKILLALGIDLFAENNHIKLDNKILEENIKLLEDYIKNLKKLL